jgi:hypothetical protein
VRKTAAAYFLLASVCLAAPGGHLVEAISDECNSLSPIWSAGLRGMPEVLTFANGIMSIRSVDNGDDAYPSAEDMISTYSDQLHRSLGASERPSVVAWVWLPPFEEWPTGYNAAQLREWLGFRVTAYDQDLPTSAGFYWPGIYISTDDAGPCLIARVGDGYGADVTIGRIAAPGWWTLGLSWNEQGRTEYYAAPGRVTLTSADLLHVTPDHNDPVANRSLDQLIGNFWALRMTYPPTGQLSTDWRVDHLRVYVRTPPPLPQVTLRREGGKVRLDIAGCARGFRYLLESSHNLTTWSTIDDFVSDGAPRTVIDTLVAKRFYRVARPSVAP